MEDEWIDAETLYQLWIAEGMVLSSDKREGETMMQVAESYMGELVHRSMVQVRFNDLESSRMKFESCSLHDLMRDLALSKAKEEELFVAIDLREGNDFHLNRSGVSYLSNTRQLVVHCQHSHRDRKANLYFKKKPNHQQHRSLLLIYLVGYDSWPRPLRSYLANFKLLRVLVLENGRPKRLFVLGTFFSTNVERALGSLVYLRYLSLRHSDFEDFSWIKNLVVLQTLVLERGNFFWRPRVSTNALRKLAYLRHLYLPYMSSPPSSKDSKLRFDGLSKLETLENFDARRCEVRDLPKLLSLRSLKLKAEGGYDDLKEIFKYLSGLALSSNSCLQYLALHIQISDQGFKSDPDMVRLLFWNHEFNLRELSIIGELPELSELFEQQQQLNHTYIDASFTGITKLELKFSYLEEDPMPVLEKVPTLRDLVLENAQPGDFQNSPDFNCLVFTIWKNGGWRKEACPFFNSWKFFAVISWRSYQKDSYFSNSFKH